MENFSLTPLLQQNVSASGLLFHIPNGNWTRVYAYIFNEIFSSQSLWGAVVFVEDENTPDQWNYVVNEKALLAPWNQDLIDACVENFEMKFGVTPTFAANFGQKQGADRFLVVSGAIPTAIFTAQMYRDFTTGLRQVLYSIEDSGGGTTTMLNAVRYFESDINVWEPPVVSPNLLPTFGGAILVEIQAHFAANFDF